MEMEESRKRVRRTPSPKYQRTAKAKRRDLVEAEVEEESEESEESEEEEGAVVPPPRPQTPKKRDLKPLQPVTMEEIGSAEEENPKDHLAASANYPPERNKRQFDKQVYEMRFCFVKTKETEVKKRDIQEINQLIKAGKLKYVYTNPKFQESDCRVLWERGYVNPSLVECKTISKEGYNKITHNGMFVGQRGERRISTSSNNTSMEKKE